VSIIDIIYLFIQVEDKGVLKTEKDPMDLIAYALIYNYLSKFRLFIICYFLYPRKNLKFLSCNLYTNVNLFSYFYYLKN